MKVIFCLTTLLSIFFSLSVKADPPVWHADWIAMPGEDGRDYGVYYFRKSIELGIRPSSFIVHVSADNRYKLFVNGVLVSLGPARSDPYHWRYETVDLAPNLVAGKNIITAIVWNEAENRPEAQISVRTAFIVQGNSPAEEVLNTNKSWKCFRDKAPKQLLIFWDRRRSPLLLCLRWSRARHSWISPGEAFIKGSAAASVSSSADGPSRRNRRSRDSSSIAGLRENCRAGH